MGPEIVPLPGRVPLGSALSGRSAEGRAFLATCTPRAGTRRQRETSGSGEQAARSEKSGQLLSGASDIGATRQRIIGSTLPRRSRRNTR